MVAGSQYQYDIDGELRDGYSKRGTAPDIGADENGGTPLFVHFDARVQGRDVLLTWTTAEEIDTAGFFLRRKGPGDADFEPITLDPIPSEGGPLVGADYTYLDTDVAAGQTYTYKLEALDIYGTSQFEGPVSVALETVCGAVVAGDQGLAAFGLVLLFLPALVVVAAVRRRKSTHP